MSTRSIYVGGLNYLRRYQVDGTSCTLIAEVLVGPNLTLEAAVRDMDGNIYVCSHNYYTGLTKFISKYDKDLVAVAGWGSSGSVVPTAPPGCLAINALGELAVGESGRVALYNSDGSVKWDVAPSGGSVITSVAFDNSGNVYAMHGTPNATTKMVSKWSYASGVMGTTYGPTGGPQPYGSVLINGGAEDVVFTNGSVIYRYTNDGVTFPAPFPVAISGISMIDNGVDGFYVKSGTTIKKVSYGGVLLDSFTVISSGAPESDQMRFDTDGNLIILYAAAKDFYIYNTDGDLLQIGTDVIDYYNFSCIVGTSSVSLNTSAPATTNYKKLLVAIANNEVWYETTPGTMAKLTAAPAITSLDVTKQITGAEGFQKIFIANEAVLQVVDFINTKLTVTALTTAPTRGATITQATSGATMVVDFVSADKTLIYGYRTSAATFTTTAGHTLSGGGMDPTTRVPSAVTVAPHWYEWTPYPLAGMGTMPTSASLVCLYRGRLVLAGNINYPYQWFMSRQANPFDWQYTSLDAQSAVAGGNSNAGQLGDIIRCLIPYMDDYLIFGCATSIWVLRGDATAGGSIDPISLHTGIFGSQSWCWGPDDTLYFWGSGGIYSSSTGLNSPQLITQDTLPSLVDDEAADTSTHTICMNYDKAKHGLHITITTNATGVNSNYWFDLRTKGFFPEEYPTTASVYSTWYYDARDPSYRKLLLGCRDGFIRCFDDTESDDDNGTDLMPIDGYIAIGPVLVGPDDDIEAKLISLSITTATSSGTVEWSLYVGDTAEEVIQAMVALGTPLCTGTLATAGRLQKLRPRARGVYMGLVLRNAVTSETFGIEKIIGLTVPGGSL